MAKLKVRNLIIQRNTLKGIVNNFKNPNDPVNYKKIGNLTNNEIKKAEAECYYNQIQENTGNSKIQWETINQVMSQNKRKPNANIVV